MAKLNILVHISVPIPTVSLSFIHPYHSSMESILREVNGKENDK
jgi:hypothetical protein